MMGVSVNKLFLLMCIYFNVPYLSSHADGEFSLIKVWGSPATYNVESSVLISDGLGKENDAGYKVQSVLTVEPIWNGTQPAAGHEPAEPGLLLLLHVSEYRTWVRRAGSAEWVAGAGGGAHTVAGRWGADGRLVAVYAPPNMDHHMLNYARSLISLLQFQVWSGEREEWDVSGRCRAHYSAPHAHAHPPQLNKVKSACSWVGGADDADDALRSSRVTRYTLTERGDGLREAVAEEEHVGAAGLRARVTLRAARVSSAPAIAPTELARLRPLPEPALALTPTAPSQEWEEGKREEVSAAVGGARVALAAMEEEAQLGQEEARAGAAAVARVARAMGGAAARDVQRAMEDPHNVHIRAALAMCAGASGSAAALAGVLASLRGDAAADRDLVRRCLASAGTAPALDDRGLATLLRLADGGGDWGAVAGAALLAAAAGSRSPGVGDGAAAAARDRLVRGLARCGTDLSCRALHVRALGNAAHPAHADLLVDEAERGAGAGASVEAVAALASLPAMALGTDRARRLLRLALRPGDLDTRAAALALAMRAVAEGAGAAGARGAGARGALGAAALALHGGGPPELRALYWRLLEELATRHATVRAHMRHIQRSHPDLDGWHARAMREAALSSALRREAAAVGGAGDAAGVALWSVQVAGGGALRRGEVALHAHTRRGGAPVPVLAVDVRARGLHALTGGEAEAAAAEEAGEVGRGEEAGAALYVSAGGARLEGVPLFAGSAELAAHVWAGTAAAPLRAATHARVWPATAAAATATPTAAGVHVRARHGGAALLALSARATVSLWSRVADAELHLQSGVLWEGALWAETPGVRGEVRAEAREEAAPALAVAVTADGYGGARVCVRAARLAYTLRRTAPTAPAATTRAPPHTLALGARNDRLCRDMHVP